MSATATLERTTPSTYDVESVASGVAARPSRRTVVRGAAWSVPVVAAAIAAPAYAASPGVCGLCPTSVNQCIIGSTGTCTCAAGLVCVGTGPLGLANICVGTDLLLTTCGGGTCTGVCLDAGGTLVTALNVFTAAITTLATTTGALCQRNTVTVTPVPTGICVSPFSGTFGSLCLITSGSGALGLGLTTAINTLTATLSSLNVALSNPCPTGTVCGGLAAFDIGGGALCLGSTAVGTLGYCSCP
ncbi:hypothetical protein GCM10027425_22280 [Alteromonas gracilis]